MQYFGNGRWDPVGEYQSAVGTSQLAPGAVTATDIDTTTVGLWSVNGGDVYRSGGKVGIGNPSPGILLDLAAGGTMGNATTIVSQHDPLNQGTKVSFGYTTGNFNDESNGMRSVVAPGTAGCGNSGDVVFYTWECNTSTSREVMRINGSGDVGIGTALPGIKLNVAGEISCVAVNITSDRNAKEQFKPVNARDVLERVARLPITEWQYKEHSDARHIGPMAQDFREAFALGRDEKHITSVDADGVALAAIQGLNEKVVEKDAELARLKAENQTLAERLAVIERALGLRQESAQPAN